MATAQREGGLYYTDKGVAVDAEGKKVVDAPDLAPNTDPSKQPGAPGSPASDPIARLVEGLSGVIAGKIPAAASVATGDDVAIPALAALPDHLAGLTSVAAVQALQARDARKGAQAQYEARLADLAGA